MVLYADVARRKQDLNEMADSFKNKGYIETSKRILILKNILDEVTIPEDFSDQLQSTFETFECEFVNKFDFGKKFRKLCVSQIRYIIFYGIKKIGMKDFAKCIHDISPLFEHISTGATERGKIAEATDSIEDRETKFYLYCFAFLIDYEFLFDDILKILYFIHANSEGCGFQLKDVEEVGIKRIKKYFQNKDLALIFLSNWKSSYWHIRNAIAHARYNYGGPSNLHFKDYNPYTHIVNYDVKMSLSDFLKFGFEVEHTIEAFLSMFVLLRIHDLICSSKLYQS